MDAPDSRRVEQTIHAWKTELPREHMWPRAIEPGGMPVMIEPYEEIRVLWWMDVNRKAMALVSWRNKPYLVTEDDLEQRTTQVFRSGL